MGVAKKRRVHFAIPQDDFVATAILYGHLHHQSFKSGESADFDEVGKGMDRIRKVLAHEGFVSGNLQIVRRIDEGRKTVNATLKIDEAISYQRANGRGIGSEWRVAHPQNVDTESGPAL